MTRRQNTPGNSFNTALNLGSFKNKTRSIQHTVGRSNPSNFYSFKVRSTSVMVVSLTKLSGDADMEIYYQSRNNPAVFSNPGKSNEVALESRTPPGLYYIRVFPGSGRKVDYTLTIHSVAAPRVNRNSRRASQSQPPFQPMASSGRSRLTSSKPTARSLWQ
jgi:hypothetical protein